MWHDVESAAREYKVGQSTLRRLIRESKLDVIRFGRRILISPGAIEKLLRVQAGRRDAGN